MRSDADWRESEDTTAVAPGPSEVQLKVLCFVNYPITFTGFLL